MFLNLMAMLVVGIMSVFYVSCGDKEKEVIVPEEEEIDYSIDLVTSREAVDLGLPSGTLWASMNVGANSNANPGGYYRWGETKEIFMIHSEDPYACDYEYEYYDANGQTKYIDIGRDISGTQYDVAHALWGQNWKMPTLEQFLELWQNCKHSEYTLTGRKGYVFVGKNGNKIFLPFGGQKSIGGEVWYVPTYIDKRTISLSGAGGLYYWTSSRYDVENAPEGGAWMISNNGKLFCGRSLANNVRPVYNNSGGSSSTFDSSLLIGSWKTTFYGNDYEIFTFKDDKSYIHKGVSYGNDYKEAGTWTLDANTKILTLTYSDGSRQEGEIVKLTATELEFLNSVYLRIYDDSEDVQDDGGVAQSFEGSGTVANPYIISKPSELRKLSKDTNNGEDYDGVYFKLTKDIVINYNVLDNEGNEVSGRTFEQWKPITKFAGILDGNGHCISGIYIVYRNTTSNSGRTGFVLTLNGTIKNLTIKDSYIYGYDHRNDILSVSGLVGYLSEGVVDNCHVYATVIADGLDYSHAAGVVYDSYKGSIKNCSNHGKIEAQAKEASWAAGVLYKNSSSTTIDKCTNYGNVKAKYASGVVESTNGIVTNCYNSGKVIGTAVSAAIIASNGGRTVNCCNKGIIGGGGRVNGISGVSTIFNSVNIGSNDRESSTVYGISEGAINNRAENCYVIESFCTNLFKWYSEEGVKNCKFMSASEMKQSDFLDELNKNATAMGSSYCQWKFGKDGYPTLEFVIE